MFIELYMYNTHDPITEYNNYIANHNDAPRYYISPLSYKKKKIQTKGTIDTIRISDRWLVVSQGISMRLFTNHFGG